MKTKHRRLETMIFVKNSNEDSPNISDFYNSSDSSSECPFFLQGFAPGSVYFQAYKLFPEENYSTDFDSYSNNSKEVIISDLDLLNDSAKHDEISQISEIIEELIETRMQTERLHEEKKQEIKKFLLDSLNLIEIRRI